VLLSLWLSLNMPATIVTLALLFLSFALLLAWLCFASRYAPVIQHAAGVVPPFVNIGATLFGLMLTFLAQDIWEANRQAKRGLGVEHEQLVTMLALDETPGGADENLRTAVRNYVQAVVTYEWPSMENGLGAPEAETALDDLTRLAAEAPVEPRLAQAVFDTAMKLRAARERRLGIANDFPDDRKWLAVILLGLFTQMSLAATHLDRIRAQLLAQLVFGAGAVTAISLIASIEQPFSPPNAISPQPLIDVIDRIEKR